MLTPQDIAHSGWVIGYTQNRICHTQKRSCNYAFMKVTVADDKNIALENNFFPKVFSQIVLPLNCNSFQTADFPDIIDTIMKYITLPKDFAKTEGCITGWFPDAHSGGVVNQLPSDATNAQLANRLNLEKVNTGFQYGKKYFTPNAGAAAAGENKFTIIFPCVAATAKN